MAMALLWRSAITPIIALWIISISVVAFKHFIWWTRWYSLWTWHSGLDFSMINIHKKIFVLYMVHMWPWYNPSGPMAYLNLSVMSQIIQKYNILLHSTVFFISRKNCSSRSSSLVLDFSDCCFYLLKWQIFGKKINQCDNEINNWIIWK